MIRKLIVLGTLTLIFALVMSIPVCQAENAELIDLFKLTAQKFSQGQGKLTLDDGFAVTGTQWRVYRDNDRAYGGSGTVVVYGQSIVKSDGQAGLWNFDGVSPFNDSAHVYSLQLTAPAMAEGYYSQFSLDGYLASAGISCELVKDQAAKNKFSGWPTEPEAQCYKVAFPGNAPVYITVFNHNYPTRSGGTENRLVFCLRSSLFEAPAVHFSFNDLNVWVGKRAFILLGNAEFKSSLLKVIGEDRTKFLLSANYNPAATPVEQRDGALNMTVLKGHDAQTFFTTVFVFPDNKIVVYWRERGQGDNNGCYYDYIFATGKKPLLLYSGNFRNALGELTPADARHFWAQMEDQ